MKEQLKQWLQNQKMMAEAKEKQQQTMDGSNIWFGRANAYSDTLLFIEELERLTTETLPPNGYNKQGK